MSEHLDDSEIEQLRLAKATAQELADAPETEADSTGSVAKKSDLVGAWGKRRLRDHDPSKHNQPSGFLGDPRI